MNVVIMPAAEADLLAIGLWIAEDSQERAESFVEELRAVCKRLAHAPRGYPVVERYKRLNIRRRSYKDYLVFYRVGSGQIEVLHVLHGAAIMTRSCPWISTKPSFAMLYAANALSASSGAMPMDSSWPANSANTASRSIAAFFCAACCAI